jgi:sulfoxide reductase catalytic subunit YedY
MKPLTRDDVTPEHLYLRRRAFIRGLGLAAGGALLSTCGVPGAPETPWPVSGTAPAAEVTFTPPPGASKATDELGNSLTDEHTITRFNNYFEFSREKEGIAELSAGLITDPWPLVVDGMVAYPRTYSIGELRAIPQEERIYRLRCVEAWAMVIPWLGFPLARILDEVQPTAEARYVRFGSLADPEQMPRVQFGRATWPYVEGLRLDEAQHPLTILAMGLYGHDLPPQNGAPIRLVVPWKYGFKSIKAVVRITLTDEQPISYWERYAPREYGFYANVNPDVPHPRWSQASEREIGKVGQRPTLLFNGYGDEVADLYTGMDLGANY